MKGRVDTSRYQKGAETIENAVVAVHGGVDRRGGFRYLATAKLGDERRVRLIRYVFNVDQAYLIEFGQQYVRFYTSTGAVILDDAPNTLELASTYTADQVIVISHKQGGDTMFLRPEKGFTRRRRSFHTNRWSPGPVPGVTNPKGARGKE